MTPQTPFSGGGLLPLAPTTYSSKTGHQTPELLVPGSIQQKLSPLFYHLFQASVFHRLQSLVGSSNQFYHIPCRMWRDIHLSTSKPIACINLMSISDYLREILCWNQPRKFPTHTLLALWWSSYSQKWPSRNFSAEVTAVSSTSISYWKGLPSTMATCAMSTLSPQQQAHSTNNSGNTGATPRLSSSACLFSDSARSCDALQQFWLIF